MEALERISLAMNFQEPDRVPVYQMIDRKELLDQFGGEGSHNERVARMFAEFGIDCCAYTPSQDLTWIDELMSFWERFLGVDSHSWGIEQSGETAWIAKRPFKDLEGLARHLPSRPDMHAVGQDFLAWFVPIRRALEPHTILLGDVMGCVGSSILFCGPELFFTAIYEAPEIVETLFDAFADCCQGITTAVSENDLGPALHLADDIAHSTALLVSPDFLRRVQFPRLKRIVAPLKKKGIKVIYHSDGDVSAILDDLVNQVGIDGLHPLEPCPGLDIFEIRRLYPSLILFGGLDYVKYVTQGDPAGVRAQAKRLLQDLGPGGGYFFGASADIDPAAKLENAMEMFRAVSEYGQYPILNASKASD
jgi:hypothetical protein